MEKFRSVFQITDDREQKTSYYALDIILIFDHSQLSLRWSKSGEKQATSETILLFEHKENAIFTKILIQHNFRSTKI